MENDYQKEYLNADLVKLKDKFEDNRGFIQPLCDLNMKNASLIYTKTGQWRANHYHKKDWHLMYILDGKMDYFYKQNKEIYYLKLKKGDLIFTPAKEIHATYFPLKTVLIVGSKNPRDQKTYEKDTVRVNFIDMKNIESIKKNAKKIR